MSSIPASDLCPDTNYGNSFPEDWYWFDNTEDQEKVNTQNTQTK